MNSLEIGRIDSENLKQEGKVRETQLTSSTVAENEVGEFVPPTAIFASYNTDTTIFGKSIAPIPAFPDPECATITLQTY